MSWMRRCVAVLALFTLALSATAVPLRSRPWVDESWNKKLFENSLGMKLVRIEAGVFVMGSPNEELERQAQETPHQVEIRKAFYMGKFEVTQHEYELVMGKNPASFSKDGKNAALVAGLDTRRFPIEMVS